MRSEWRGESSSPPLLLSKKGKTSNYNERIKDISLPAVGDGGIRRLQQQ